jgi:outer membrane receptor protein involved in Fe transport
MNKLLMICFLSTFIFSLQARPYPHPSPGPLPVSGIIKGKVIEATSNTPVEYATVTLYNAKDSSMIAGVITNADGSFEFKKLDAGEYNIIVKFMGFRKVFIAGVVISDMKTVTDVGTVSLKAEATNLNEVEVVGQAPLVEYKIDRKVVNVDQQLQAQGGTAVDALERVPSIKTDLDGNVTLRGSTNFTVLIDGKPSILTGSDALNQIPASTIDKIEIITNPSAKYDPDGTAGIINIITKKNSLKGLSGIAYLSAGTSPDYSGSVLLNYRTKKASISLGADFGNREMTGYRNGYRESYPLDTVNLPNDTTYLQTNNKNTMNRQSVSFKAGIDYSLSLKNTLTLEGNYRLFDMSRAGGTKNEEWGSIDINRQNYFTDNTEKQNHPTYQATLRDVHKFNTEGTELTSSLTYDQGNDEGHDNTFQYLTDEAWEDTLRVEYNYKTNTTEMEREIDGDIDFQHSFSDNGKLEAGFQLRMELNDVDYKYINYIPDSTFQDPSNRYKFFNNIYAVYGTYAKEFKKLGLKAGLRAEYTDRNLRQLTDQTEYPYQKFDIYPSLYLTYYLPYNQQVQLSYSKRVNRPHGDQLNPYVLFSDAFTSFSGNPKLEPEFSHSLELNYQKYFGYSFLTLETYYRLTNNKMTRVQSLDDKGVMNITMQNIDNDRSLGVEMSGNIQVNRWFTINPIATIYDYKLNGTSDTSNTSRSSTNWNASIEFAANLKSNTRMRLNANYDSPTVTVDGTRKGVFYMGFSARQDFLKKNLSVTLNIRDVLNSRKMKSTSEAYNYYATGENWRKAPIFSLTLSYKWNNYSRKRNGNDTFDGDYDIINGNSF